MSNKDTANFKNKVAIITGSATGMGKATRELLAAKGCKVYGFDIQSFKDDKSIFVKCDVRKYENVKKAVQKVFKKEGKIDFLFANAGIHLFAGIEDTSLEQFENILGINLKGIFYTLKEVLPIMRKQKSGSIVLMGSDQVFIGKGKSAVYGLTKGAIGQLTKSTAIDYAQYNIRVNCICPGTIDTPLVHNTVKYFSQISKTPEKDIYESLKNSQPIKRLGEPIEIARVVAFMLSDEASFMTGSLVSVDGGYVCQ